jgi:ATP-dependent DNA helicase PIF1
MMISIAKRDTQIPFPMIAKFREVYFDPTLKKNPFHGFLLCLSPTGTLGTKYPPQFYLYIEKITTFLSISQAESFATIMNTTQNCFLTGGAGSGKSFLLKVFHPLFIKLYGFCGVALIGPTNIAVANIFGITLHKFLGLTVGGISESLLRNWRAHNRQEFLKQYLVNLNNMKPSVTQNASSCQVLIIDEAGMIDWFTFNLLDEFLRMVRGSSLPFGGVRIILIGDVLQLEPVVSQSAKGCEKANWIFYQHELFKSFFVAYLRTNLRQKKDSEFIDALNQVRIGDGSAALYLNDSIFSLNSTSKSTLILAKSKKEYFNANDDKKNAN